MFYYVGYPNHFYYKIKKNYIKTLKIIGDFFALLDSLGDSLFSIRAKHAKPKRPTGFELSSEESSNSISPLSSAIFKRYSLTF